jgi:hypothetical protein
VDDRAPEASAFAPNCSDPGDQALADDLAAACSAFATL